MKTEKEITNLGRWMSKNKVFISPLGKDGKGFYENTCRKMLIAGLLYIKKGNKIGKFSTLRNNSPISAFGLMFPKNKDAKKLEKIMVDINPDCTGGQFEATMFHLEFINRFGLDKWKEEMTKEV